MEVSVLSSQRLNNENVSTFLIWGEEGEKPRDQLGALMRHPFKVWGKLAFQLDTQ